MRNPFRKRPDHYPAIQAIGDEWVARSKSHGGDEAEFLACLAAFRATQNWVVYATVGKDRHDEKILNYCRSAAQQAYDFSKLCSRAEDEKSAA